MSCDYLVVGDWSDDGHGKTESFIIEHNMGSREELFDAFTKGCEIIGLKFHEHVADGYEEGHITKAQRDKIEAVGINTEPYLDVWWGEDNEDKFSFVDGPESYANLWAEIAKLGRNHPSAHFVIKRLGALPIGGYGLFY